MVYYCSSLAQLKRGNCSLTVVKAVELQWNYFIQATAYGAMAAKRAADRSECVTIEFVR